jgi:hypothetical protein
LPVFGTPATRNQWTTVDSPERPYHIRTPAYGELRHSRNSPCGAGTPRRFPAFSTTVPRRCRYPYSRLTGL